MWDDPVTLLRLSANERVALEHRARRPETAQALALRGTAGAKLRTGHTQLARELGTTQQTVWKWRRSFVRARLAPCSMIRAPAARAGLAEQVELVVRLTLESRPRDATQLR